MNPAFVNWIIDSVIMPYQKHLEESKHEKAKKEIHAQSSKKGHKRV